MKVNRQNVTNQGFSKEVKLCYSPINKQVLYIARNIWKVRFNSDSEKFSKIDIKKTLFLVRNLMYEFNVNHL